MENIPDGCNMLMGGTERENVTQRRQRATVNVHRSNDSDTDIDAVNERKPKKSSSMYAAELEETVHALKQRVNQLEES